MSDFRGVTSILDRARRSGVPFPLHERLLAIDSLRSGFERATVAVVGGPGPRLGSVDDTRALNAGADTLLEHFRERWEAGDTSGQTPAEWYYAAFLLFAGRDRYAALAEREAIHFLTALARMYGSELIELSGDKASAASGPDAVFVGGADHLGLAAEQHVGLDIKTVVSETSLKAAMNQLATQPGVAKHGYRAVSKDNTVAKLRHLGRGSEADELAARPDSEYSPILVVRRLSDAPFSGLPKFARDAFDVVMTFDVFGRLRVDESKMAPAAISKVAYNAGVFNAGRLRELSAEFSVPLELLDLE